MVPARNKYWLLDSVAGWRIQTANTAGLTFTTDEGDITLDPLPGSAVFLDSALVSGIVCPTALASNNRGCVFVLDGATNRITMLDLSAKRAQLITAFGGIGSELRCFRTPRSLTVLPTGSIAVADTGNGRVQLFSGPPYVLLRVWGGPDRPMKPCAVATDACGLIYILDRKSRSILRVRADGEWFEPIGSGVLTDPLALAVAADRTVAVVDSRGNNATVVIFPPDGDKPVRLTLVSLPLSVAFDSSGNLYAGTGSAVVAKLERDDTQMDGWGLAGDGVSDADGAIGQVAWVQGQGLISILNDPAATAPRLFSMDPAGAFVRLGQFTTRSLDSDIEKCTWHRVQVLGTVPPGTSLQIESQTSEQAEDSSTEFVPCTLTGSDNADCLVQSAPGRYLKLRLTLRSSGAVSPQIHALRVFFPRESYLQYLPAVFQQSDESRLFLDRFLSIFQTTFDNFDHFLDNLWQLFDPWMVPEKFFPWLAAWVALPLDPGLPLPQKRRLLQQAFQNYLMRGTVAGLQQVIHDYTGVANIRILEHFRMRNWTSLPYGGGLDLGARLWSRNFYARLQVGVSSQIGSFQLTKQPEPAAEPYDWGANQFSVLFPADPYFVGDVTAKVQKILDREKPAYTQAFLCPIFPRLRVGVQATLGVDAYVGKVNSMILGKLATLGYDSVLSASPAARDIQALGLSLHPRLGVDSRVL
jgi:phage tail-like protein